MSKELSDLRGYQQAHLLYHCANHRSMNLSEPGTGKTPTACMWTRYQLEYNNKRVIWSQPLSLLKKNQEEISEWTGLPLSAVRIVTGNPEQRRAAFQSDAPVLLVGHDCLAREWNHLPEDGWAYCADEWHMAFGGPDSARTLSLYNGTEKRIGPCLFMTGTLLTGKPYSAYPALHIIEPRYYAQFKAFERYHTEYDLDGKPCGWRNIDHLAKIISRHSVAVDFARAGLNAHKPIIQFIPCTMSPGLEAAYKQFEDHALLELEDQFLDAPNGGVHALRCRQLLSHPEVFDKAWVKNNGKDAALSDLLQELAPNEQFIVYSGLVPEQERLTKKLSEDGYRTALINGHVLPQYRPPIDEAFRRHEYDAVVGSPRTMSVGFNWQMVNNVFFSLASLDYREDSFEQAWKRADRGSRTFPVRIHILTYNTRVEHRMWQVLLQKRMLSQEVKTVVDSFSSRG